MATLEAAAKPFFSIITVCRNAELDVVPTIASLAAQTFQDFEYLVIDGASTDGTVKNVRENADGMRLTLVSEPDKGTYDAMNKGIQMAQGHWIYFLNAGDDFVSATVLQDVATQLVAAPAIGLAYGDVIYRGTTGQRLVRFDWVNKNNLLFEHLCHQAVFARQSVFQKMGGFDTQYRINADFDWLLRLFRAGVPSHYLSLPVAFYDDAGLSANNKQKTRAERSLVRAKYLPKGCSVPFEVVYRIVRKLLRVTNLSRR